MLAASVLEKLVVAATVSHRLYKAQLNIIPTPDTVTIGSSNSKVP